MMICVRVGQYFSIIFFDVDSAYNSAEFNEALIYF